jgi:hypothetical protein
MAIVVTTSNSASTTTINNLEVKKITSDEEEFTDKKISDTVLITLQKMSTKINLTIRNQDLILRNQQKIFIEIEKLKQQQEEKKTITSPPPPPPPPPPVEKTKKIEKKLAGSDPNCMNGAKASNNKSLLVPTNESIQKQFEKIVKNPKKASLLPQTSTVPLLEDESLQNRTNLRRTESMRVTSNYKQPETQALSVSDRIKHFNSTPV